LVPRTVLPAWSAFSAIEFTVGGDRLLAADGIGQVTAWALATSEEILLGTIDKNLVEEARFSPDVRFADRIEPLPAPQVEAPIQTFGFPGPFLPTQSAAVSTTFPDGRIDDK
ncbi:MAG: hypothetical protein ACREIV_07085, partial [Planctomycetaceae bacterium]